MPKYRIEYTETLTRVEYVECATLAEAQDYADEQVWEGAPKSFEQDSLIVVSDVSRIEED